MLIDKFRITVVSLLIFGGIMLAIIAFQLNNISKQSSNNHRYMINSDGSVVLGTQTGNAYEIDGNEFVKIEMK